MTSRIVKCDNFKPIDCHCGSTMVPICECQIPGVDKIVSTPPKSPLDLSNITPCLSHMSETDLLQLLRTSYWVDPVCQKFAFFKCLHCSKVKKTDWKEYKLSRKCICLRCGTKYYGITEWRKTVCMICYGGRIGSTYPHVPYIKIATTLADPYDLNMDITFIKSISITNGEYYYNDDEYAELQVWRESMADVLSPSELRSRNEENQFSFTRLVSRFFNKLKKNEKSKK